jgi:hypothetical protein
METQLLLPLHLLMAFAASIATVITIFDSVTSHVVRLALTRIEVITLMESQVQNSQQASITVVHLPVLQSGAFPRRESTTSASST